MIGWSPGSQPDYAALDAVRRPVPEGPPVTVLGAQPMEIPGRAYAQELRRREAESVALAVAGILRDRWSVDEGTPTEPSVRPARLGDIAILIPSRTSLADLEDALEAASIPYRAEASSLVYNTREVRDVLLALQAVADPTDELALVAALRSSLYGCGDDDLAHWRLAYGGRFSLIRSQPDSCPADHPVAEGIAHLAELHRAKRWTNPPALIDRLVRERGAFETAVAGGRPRDVWRRLRFVTDQARAWADAGGTNLRSYLEWARLQGADNARVTESVLPETDDDSVRILTVHGAKGLEFPIVVLSGMTTRLDQPARGPTVAFGFGDAPVVKLRGGVESENYEAWKPIDEQMDAHERRRLLYVACTRARDHLVVSLHRRTPNDRGNKENSAAWALADAGAAEAGAADSSTVFDRAEQAFAPAATTPPAGTQRATLPDRHEWEREYQHSLATASIPTTVSATGLADADGGYASDAGFDKDRGDSEPPPWSKGRYGTAIGRAVHGVLQDIDLATGRGLEALAERQAAAEGVSSRTGIVAGLARAALDTAVAREASAGEYWRELFVAAPIAGRLLEGYVDLAYRSPEGLVVVDWKTDSVAGDDGVDAKLARYRLQGASYAAALEAVTGEHVARMVFVFVNRDGAVEAELPDLRGAMAEAEAAVAAVSG